MSRVEEALSRLHDAMIDRSFQPLDFDYYCGAHALFRSCTNEESMIVNWLSEWIMAHPLENCSSRSPAILSIGCGDGSIDTHVSQYLSKNRPYQSPLTYVGIEPNTVSSSIFLRRINSIGSVAATVIVEQWPQCSTKLVGQQFDFILFVHSLYYMVDINEALVQALRLLRPHGQLIILIAPHEGLSKMTAQLMSLQRGNSPLWWAETVEAVIHTNQYAIKNSAVLNCQLNLSICRDETSLEGKAILDFLAFARLPDDIRRSVLNVLNELKNEQIKREATDTLIIDHSVYVWVLHQPHPVH